MSAAAFSPSLFVIGLREGVEAALIVGIVAAFLHQQGRRDALRWMWAGVLLAAAACLAVGVLLEIVDSNLDQRRQERFETVIALVAVGMVTSMIVWMRANARTLASELRESAAGALAQGSAVGLVAMAFLAVMREGLETALFLLATFQSQGIGKGAAVASALGGIAIAVAIGWGIYRGGVRIDLGRFFRVTAVLLVVIAAGLLANATYSATESNWLTSFQDRPLDLTWLIPQDTGSVVNGLFDGLLGLRGRPTVAALGAWAIYAVPMLAFVLWPRDRRIVPRRRVATTLREDLSA